MDEPLDAHVNLDVATDDIRIDVRGSLNQDSRGDLMQLIQRIRRMGISSRIRVDLAQARFVESGALAGLRHDLNAVDDGARQLKAGSLTLAAGVSLELQMTADDFGRDFQPLDLSADSLASIDPSGTRPLAGYSDDDLLAASDSVFGKLDDPDAGAPSGLLAQYEDISLELTRREFNREAEPA